MVRHVDHATGIVLHLTLGEIDRAARQVDDPVISDRAVIPNDESAAIGRFDGTVVDEDDRVHLDRAIGGGGGNQAIVDDRCQVFARAVCEDDLSTGGYN